jgi:hypothetical protein
MHNVDDRSQNILGRLRVEKILAESLEQKILNQEAREFLLKGATNSLRDVESFILPQAAKALTPDGAAGWFAVADFQLQSAHRQLKHAQDMVDKFGSNVQVIG